MKETEASDYGQRTLCIILGLLVFVFLNLI